MKTALQIIEEVYSLAINPTEDYFAQLEPLAKGGELANHNSSQKILFSLCMLVDSLIKRIEAIESASPIKNIPLDPSSPIK